MSRDGKQPNTQGSPGASGYEATEVADSDNFPSGEYSDVATIVAEKARRAGVAEPPRARDITVPSQTPSEPSRRGATRDTGPSLQHRRPDSRTLPGEETIDGRYRVRDLIARGSMSRVYLAEHVSIGRMVALKIISRDLITESDSVERFQQEARVLAKINHPNIVTLYDIGETDVGDPFIVMEYIKGASLAAIIKAKGRLDPTRTVGLLLQTARGLATVHDAGVIHRDLKPSNILVVRLDEGVVRVKIADFGLAKVVQDRAKGDYRTRAGAILGTPEYMAPEQVKGSHVDKRADLYSLGCMAYEMLTGMPPFVGQEMATLYKQLHEVPKPMREACPEADIPEALEPVIRKALQKDPEDRYSTATQFYTDLLAASDAAGIRRADLRMIESFIQDTSYATMDEPTSTLIEELGSSSKRRPRQSKTVIGLLVAIAAMIALVGGVAIGKFVASPSESTPSAVGPAVVEATGFVVTTDPPGGYVSVDGSEPTRAPATFAGLSVGPHEIKAAHRGYLDKITTAEATAGVTGVVKVPLARPTYEAHIQTVPSGAMVEVDGEPVGVSPVKLKVTELEFHEVQATLLGYQTAVRMVGASDSMKDLTLKLRPELREYGTLMVSTKLASAVWIDGEDTGEVTPTGEIQLSPGRHTVWVIDARGAKRTFQVKIKESDAERLDL